MTEEKKHIENFVQSVKDTCTKFKMDFEDASVRAFVLRITEHAITLTEENPEKNWADEPATDLLYRDLVRSLA